jgi:hypothetical protein
MQTKTERFDWSNSHQVTSLTGKDNIYTSLSATGITRCSAWFHLGNINYTARVHNMYSWCQLLVYCIFKKSIEEKKGDNIEKYVEKYYTLKIQNKWKKIK